MNLLRNKFFLGNLPYVLRFFFTLLISLSCSKAYAMFSANPAGASLLSEDLFFKTSWTSFRMGYFDDWVYKQRFQEEFFISEKTRTKNQLRTHAATATWNLFQRLDLYGALGSSQMQVDSQIYTKNAFSWLTGARCTLCQHHNFFVGIDLKYFESNQKLQYFIIEGAPYNIISPTTSQYYDVQGSLGLAYRFLFLSPYLNVTYIYTHLLTTPPIVPVRFPDEDAFIDLEIPSLHSRKLWGLALGLSLIDLKTASLSVEWRVFNQNALNVNGEIRF